MVWTAGAEWELPWLLRCYLSLIELGLKNRAFIFHFLSFCFPLYTNTVGTLEKTKKITWDFFSSVQRPPPSTIYEQPFIFGFHMQLQLRIFIQPYESQDS